MRVNTRTRTSPTCTADLWFKQIALLMTRTITGQVLETWSATPWFIGHYQNRYFVSDSRSYKQTIQPSLKMEFSALDSDGNPIETTSLPVRDPRFPDKRALLLFFLPPLPANSGPYTI